MKYLAGLLSFLSVVSVLGAIWYPAYLWQAIATAGILLFSSMITYGLAVTREARKLEVQKQLMMRRDREHGE